MSEMNSRNYCTYCPKMCHFSCPVAEAEKDEAVTPWGKQQTAKLIEEGRILLNEENALPAYKCLTCRASETFCAHGIVVADSLHEMREKAVASDAAPAAVFAFEKKFRRHNNPYGIDLQEKIKKRVSPSWFEADRSTIFFPSCHLTALSPSGVGDALDVFEKLKIGGVRVFDDTLQCCGFPQWVLGFKEEFGELAHIQYQGLRKASSILAGAPECAWAFKELYPRFGLNLKAPVYTLPEFLYGYLTHLPFRAKPKGRIHYFYHDACYEGRYLHQYNEPRELLQMVTGFWPEEFSWNRKESLCSGAGGGYELIEPRAAASIPKRHLEEMNDRGVKTLVSSCPKSCQQFRSLGQRIIVKDWISFLNENLL